MGVFTAAREPSQPQRLHAAGWALRPIVLLLAGALVAGFALDWPRLVSGRADQSTDDAYLQSDLTPLAAKVAGYVRSVPVGDFQRVHAGELLVEIAPDDYAAQVAQAAANVAGVEAQIANLVSQRALQQANIRAAEAFAAATAATVTRYSLEAQRQRTLLATSIAGTCQVVEQAEANERQSAATLQQHLAQAEAQRRQLDVLDTQQRQLRANFAAQQAALRLAHLNLGYTRITAPADGMVGQRQVRPGQYVGVGTQVISLVPLPKVWVMANLKETQMTRVRTGQRATVTVDAFPSVVLTGQVDSWSPASGSQFSLLPPDNATGSFTKVVQRIPVKITLDLGGPEQAELLRPGMSVIATIHTADQAPLSQPGKSWLSEARP